MSINNKSINILSLLMDYFPNEILVFIFHFIKPHKWFRLRRVNHQFQIIIESMMNRYPLLMDKLMLSKITPQLDITDTIKTRFRKDLLTKNVISVLVQKCNYNMLTCFNDKQVILHEAIKLGNLEMVKWANTKSKMACYYAIKFNQFDILKWLFNNGYERCHDLLNLSLYAKDADIFQWLLGQKNHAGKVYNYDMVRNYHLLCRVNPYFIKDAYEKGFCYPEYGNFIMDVYSNADLKFIRWFVQTFNGNFNFIPSDLTDDEWLLEYEKYRHRYNGNNILDNVLSNENLDIVLKYLEANIHPSNQTVSSWKKFEKEKIIQILKYYTHDHPKWLVKIIGCLPIRYLDNIQFNHSTFQVALAHGPIETIMHTAPDDGKEFIDIAIQRGGYVLKWFLRRYYLI